MQKKKRNLDTGPTLFTKQIIDLNVKCKTIKLLENNIGENLDDLNMAMNFLIQHQKHNP